MFEQALDRGRPVALLLLRLYLGGFLIWGVWDNVVEPSKMAEFVGFLRQFRCPFPEIAGPVSVYAQLAAGVLIALGLWFRPACLVIMANFAVAFTLFAGTGADPRAQYPHTILIFLGLFLATQGAGPLALDRLIARRRARGLRR